VDGPGPWAVVDADGALLGVYDGDGTGLCRAVVVLADGSGPSDDAG